MLNFNIGDFFKRVTSTQGKELHFRNVVRETIQKHTGLEVSVGSIKIVGGVINLKDVSSAARSAIFIKKQVILADINAAQQAYIVKDLR